MRIDETTERHPKNSLGFLESKILVVHKAINCFTI